MKNFKKLNVTVALDNTKILGNIGVLSAILVAKSHNIDIDVDDDDFMPKFHEALDQNDFLETLANVLHDILSEKIAGDISRLEEHTADVSGKLQSFKNNLKDNKTAKLWVMYLEVINRVCKLTKAQTTGNWLLHLEAIS